MEKKHYRVNWVDGMKIRKQHFIEEQKANTQSLMKGVSSQLNGLNFGLLAPSLQRENSSFKLNIEIENTETIHVKIIRCVATTPGGFLVDIGDESGQPRQFTLDLPDDLEDHEHEKRYKIVLAVSPFETQEVGDADPEEVPPRRPYVESTYQLGLLPVSTSGEAIKSYGVQELPIGEITSDGNGIRLNQDYIPPSMAVYSSAQLIDIHTQFYHSLLKLENLCINIIRKIAAKDQDFLLARIVDQISHEILSYLGTTLYQFNSELRYAPPVKMVEHIAGLGRLLRNALDIHQGMGREELINYFIEWCEINQGAFEKVITQVVNHTYDHTSTAEAMDCCSQFLDEIVGLYVKLDKLDYIGRKSEKDIFVKEDKKEEKPKRKGRINFLAQ